MNCGSRSGRRGHRPRTSYHTYVASTWGWPGTPCTTGTRKTIGRFFRVQSFGRRLAASEKYCGLLRKSLSPAVPWALLLHNSKTRVCQALGVSVPVHIAVTVRQRYHYFGTGGCRGGRYGSPSKGPKSGGGLRCRVAASNAEAMRNSVASSNGRAIKSTPTGKLAFM